MSSKNSKYWLWLQNIFWNRRLLLCFEQTIINFDGISQGVIEAYPPIQKSVATKTSGQVQASPQMVTVRYQEKKGSQHNRKAPITTPRVTNAWNTDEDLSFPHALCHQGLPYIYITVFPSRCYQVVLDLWDSGLANTSFIGKVTLCSFRQVALRTDLLSWEPLEIIGFN